jgi:multiple antibiotic resistance protein
MFADLTRDFLILWATIDPIGTLALFAALTAAMPAEEQRRIALKATFYAAAILLASILAGQVVLGAMGVQLRSVQLAGGAILFLFGLQMVFGTVGSASAPGAEPGHDLAVFPLAVPSIASPGAIMAVILLTDNQTHPIPTQAATTAVLLLILGVTLLFMLGARPIIARLGHNGAAILIRVMGMVLAAYAAELVMGALGVAGWGPPGA